MFCPKDRWFAKINPKIYLVITLHKLHSTLNLSELFSEKIPNILVLNCQTVTNGIIFYSTLIVKKYTLAPNDNANTNIYLHALIKWNIMWILVIFLNNSTLATRTLFGGFFFNFFIGFNWLIRSIYTLTEVLWFDISYWFLRSDFYTTYLRNENEYAFRKLGNYVYTSPLKSNLSS